MSQKKEVIMGLFSDKRGISPLIATILLIAFSILLGAVVMSWGESYIEEKAEFVTGVQELVAGCDAVDLRVLELRGVPQACQRGESLEVWLDNGPSSDLFDVHARVVGTVASVTHESVSGPILKGSAVKTIVPASGVGPVLQLKLTPKIMPGTEVIFCAKNAIVVENIGLCA